MMHKPVGQGERENMITEDEPLLKEFCRLINEQKMPYKIGFDSCSVPMIVNYCPNIAKITLDTCEGGRYSCYISSEMVMSPCSFDCTEQYGVSLRDMSIREAWESPQFDAFRNSLRKSCPDCQDREFCMGGCPLVPEVALCPSTNKKQLYILNKEEAL